VRYYWGFGTALSCAVLAASLFFIVVEYCTQSHLSTEEYENAMQGLRAVRRFKKYTNLFRRVPDDVIEFVKRLYHMVRRRGVRSGRRSLVWTWQVAPPQRPRVVVDRLSDGGGEETYRENIPLHGRPSLDRQYSFPEVGGSDYGGGSLQRLPTISVDGRFE
jgi:hypothetical protein